MLVLVVGEFDLSIGATLGISQYLVLKLITHYGLSWQVAIVATLGVGAAIGAANAIAVVGLGINSFIATIGIATILEGLVQWISDGNQPLFGGAPNGFTSLAQTKHLVVLPVYYALASAVALWVLLEFTVVGRQMRATGANRARREALRHPHGPRARDRVRRRRHPRGNRRHPRHGAGRRRRRDVRPDVSCSRRTPPRSSARRRSGPASSTSGAR